MCMHTAHCTFLLLVFLLTVKCSHDFKSCGAYTCGSNRLLMTASVVFLFFVFFLKTCFHSETKSGGCELVDIIAA